MLFQCETASYLKVSAATFWFKISRGRWSRNEYSQLGLICTAPQRIWGPYSISRMERATTNPKLGVGIEYRKHATWSGSFVTLSGCMEALGLVAQAEQPADASFSPKGGKEQRRANSNDIDIAYTESTQ